MSALYYASPYSGSLSSIWQQASEYRRVTTYVEMTGGLKGTQLAFCYNYTFNCPHCVPLFSVFVMHQHSQRSRSE